MINNEEFDLEEEYNKSDYIVGYNYKNPVFE